jgi:hypothetical protein
MMVLTANGASSHLQTQILAIGFMTGPRDLAVVHTNAREYSPRTQHLESHPKGATVAHDLDHNIRTPTIGKFLDSVTETSFIFLEIPWLGAETLGQL